MTRAAGLACAIGLFVVLATANAGGYRFGISDQAFYVPAVDLRLDPQLFPRDRAVLLPQLRVWWGGDLLAVAIRASGGDMPRVFVVVYVVTLVALAIAALLFARSMGASWWVAAGFLALLTLRHRIARTGANSLEGYMHPRMLAFAIGVATLALVAKRRFLPAAAGLAIAYVVHPTTAFWFGGVWLVALLVDRGRARAVAAVLAAGLLICIVGAWTPRTFGLQIMDAGWLTVLADKDYLFSTDWPVYAWISNLAYVAVVIAVHRRRVRAGVSAPGERALVAGALALVAGFLITLPLTAAHVAIAVQLQINRVFWLLDFLAAWSLAWWLVEDLGARRAAWLPAAVAAALTAIAVARGVYVLKVEAGRSLVQAGWPTGSWMDAMQFLRTQPTEWLVLADPQHGWKYGLSVRVAAARDVVLEAGKDTSMSMYDRTVARRVAERQLALAAFDSFGTADIQHLTDKFQADVFVDHVGRELNFPVLYQNADFIIYRLR